MLAGRDGFLTPTQQCVCVAQRDMKTIVERSLDDLALQRIDYGQTRRLG